MTHSSSLAMWQYSIEPRARRKYVKGFGFSSSARQYKEIIIEYKTRCSKNCF